MSTTGTFHTRRHASRTPGTKVSLTVRTSRKLGSFTPLVSNCSASARTLLIGEQVIRRLAHEPFGLRGHIGMNAERDGGAGRVAVGRPPGPPTRIDRCFSRTEAPRAL